MSTITLTLAQLRSMIGLEVIHEGVHCEVIEVLEDGPSLVLKDAGQGGIQIDQFGHPRRWAAVTYAVPVLTVDRNALHPAFLALELID